MKSITKYELVCEYVKCVKKLFEYIQLVLVSKIVQMSFIELANSGKVQKHFKNHLW